MTEIIAALFLKQAIEAGHGVGGTASAPSNPPLDIFSRLAADLDTEVSASALF